MENVTNCCNCGSPLHFEKGDDTNEYATCSYCKTEYKRNNLGVVDTHRVKILYNGKLFDMFITSMSMEYDTIDYCYIDGSIGRTSVFNTPMITLELNGRVVE